MKYPETVVQAMEEMLEEYPHVPTRTLAKRLYASYKEVFKNLEAARTALRRRRGANGKQSTKDKRFYRTKGKAGWTPKLPPSMAEEFETFEIVKPKRTAIISDIHLPYHNEAALKRWEKETKKFNPTTILLNGDTMDFYKCSRFCKDPKRRGIAFEIDCGHDFLDWLAYTFPKADIIWKDGNHDERWYKYLFNHAPEFAQLEHASLCKNLELEARGIEYVTDGRTIMVGQLAVLHGHEMQAAHTPVNAARSMMMKTMANAAMSHCHRTSEHSEPTLTGGLIRTWSMGCMCELTPEYARVNKWNHGWLNVRVSTDGSYEVENKAIRV